MLILLSKIEPWGLVVNEAMARGCIPLVSKACGARDLLSDEYIFEETSDLIHKVSSKVRTLMLEPAATIAKKNMMVRLASQLTVNQLSEQIFNELSLN